MRKLVLLAALLCTGASAVNLSQIGVNELCLVASATLDSATQIEEDKRLTSPILQTSAINKIAPLGIKVVEDGSSCAYSLVTEIQYIYSEERYLIYVTTTLRESNNTSDFSSKNSYSNAFYLTDNGLDFNQKVLIDIIGRHLDTFIADWKQSHP